MSDCPFCTLPKQRIEVASDLGLIVRDAFPISPGHTLIIPKRNVGSFFKREADDRAELMALLDKITPEEVGPDQSNPYSRFK